MRTVDRALRILNLVASRDDSEWTLSELARQSGVPKATAFRMLATLMKHGYLTRDGSDSRYRLGPHVLALAGALRPRLRLVAHPILHQLVERTGETALLHILDRADSLCLDKVDSPQPIRVTYDIGRRGPLHAGSSGKVLLAFLDSSERRRIDPLLRLTRFTDTTTTTWPQLQADLTNIREQGFVHTHGELDADVYGIGAPVWNSSGHLEAGVTLVGPGSRWTRERTAMYVEAVVDAAERISRELGFVRRSHVLSGEPAMVGAGSGRRE